MLFGGPGVKLFQTVTLYGCIVDDDNKIAAVVQAQKNAQKNAGIRRRCKISSHNFICPGRFLEDDVPDM